MITAVLSFVAGLMLSASLYSQSLDWSYDWTNSGLNLGALYTKPKPPIILATTNGVTAALFTDGTKFSILWLDAHGDQIEPILLPGNVKSVAGFLNVSSNSITIAARNNTDENQHVMTWQSTNSTSPTVISCTGYYPTPEQVATAQIVAYDSQDGFANWILTRTNITFNHYTY